MSADKCLDALDRLIASIELAKEPWVCECQRVHELARAPRTGTLVRVKCPCGTTSDVNMAPWPPDGGRAAAR